MRSIVAIDLDEDGAAPATARVWAGALTRLYHLTPSLGLDGQLVSVTVHDEEQRERGVYESDLAALVDILEDDFDRCGACADGGAADCDACGGTGAL